MIPAAVGILIAGFSSIFTGLNFIVTIHRMRAPGMSWFRLPLFIWAHYAASLIMVLGNFLIPMMIGAKDLAFPRLNLASWYMLLVGGAITLYSLVTGGIDTGWTFYAPLSTRSEERRVGKECRL